MLSKISNIFEAIRVYLSTVVKLNKFWEKNASYYQFLELKRLIEYAWNNVSFYKEFWEKNNFNPKDFQSILDISKIPMIDRNDIIENLDKFIPTNYDRKKLTLVTTGGTSGMPMKFYINNYIARAKEIAFLSTIYKSFFGMYSFDRTAILRGYKINEKRLKKKKYWQYSFVHRGLILSSFHLNSETYPLYISKLRKYKPKYIKAYPSSIVALCSLMKNAKDNKIFGLKGIICSSENIYDWQRRLVREVLDVEIYSFYGHSEKCVIAFQEKNEKMLFHPLYGFTEFIGDKGYVAKEGEEAEVVVTGFNHEYFPLIRYKTNDRVLVGPSHPIYGQSSLKILGREQDFVYDKNGDKVLFTCNDEPFWNVNGVEAYQYIQSEIGKLCVKVQVNQFYSSKDERQLIDGMKRYFINFDISLKYVDSIPKTKRGKFQYLIQNLKINDYR